MSSGKMISRTDPVIRISAGNQERNGTIRMRRDGKRLLVRLDDYKQFMQKTRGQDMSGFEAECQYELTDDGEMVLYDFGMQPGDKFRSVEGKEDICVTRIGKTEPRPDNGRSFNILYLSNGAYIIDQIGYAGCIDSNGREIVGRIIMGSVLLIIFYVENLDVRE